MCGSFFFLFFLSVSLLCSPPLLCALECGSARGSAKVHRGSRLFAETLVRRLVLGLRRADWSKVVETRRGGRLWRSGGGRRSSGGGPGENVQDQVNPAFSQLSFVEFVWTPERVVKMRHE